MKRKLRGYLRRLTELVSAGAVVGLPAPARSVERPPEAPSGLVASNSGERAEEAEGSRKRSARKDPVALRELAGSVDWRALTGVVVDTPGGERVGVVSDLLMDVDAGRVDYAVVQRMVDEAEGQLAAGFPPVDRLRWTVVQAEDGELRFNRASLLDGALIAEEQAPARSLELLRNQGYRSLSSLVETVTESVKGSDLEFVGCMIDLDRDLAVVMEVRMNKGFGTERVDASQLDWRSN